MKRLCLFLLLFFTTGVFADMKPGDFYTRGSTSAKKIALTFDDGPGPYTDQFLALLDKYQVKATFFVLGELVQYKPASIKEIVAKGHELADHTYNHTNYKNRYKEILAGMKEKGLGEKEAIAAVKGEVLASMRKSKAQIEKYSGVKPVFCRMPHGVDRPWISEAARENGYVLINWTYGADWNAGTAEELLPGYLKAINPGAIFLFHDGGRGRAKSLVITEAVIKAALEQGYEIIPVGQLLSSKN